MVDPRTRRRQKRRARRRLKTWGSPQHKQLRVLRKLRDRMSELGWSIRPSLDGGEFPAVLDNPQGQGGYFMIGEADHESVNFVFQPPVNPEWIA